MCQMDRRKRQRLQERLSAIRRPSTWSKAAASLLSVGLVAPAHVWADQPGRGLTRSFEIAFMRLAVDHHFAALRLTELAAGTDLRRDGETSSDEGTAPTPGFGATPAKATLADLRSLARRNNRMQREEIMTLQGFLRDWYGVRHELRMREESRRLIDVLESIGRGREFDHAFLEVFSRHHFTLLQPLNGCLTGSELRHDDLRRSCNQMWHSQTSDIDEMRHELERHFGIADYRPFEGRQPLATPGGAPRGQHGGDRP